MILILAGATGCATLQTPATRSTEQVLAAAGFHAQIADTPERVAELQSLPASHTGAMPPMGGAQLSPSDVSALAAYIGR